VEALLIFNLPFQMFGKVYKVQRPAAHKGLSAQGFKRFGQIHRNYGAAI